MNVCPVCPKKFKPVLGHGPSPSKYCAIGERPGLQEMRSGIPFVGPSGMEWNETYLPLAGIKRSEIYTTNTVKCFAVNNKTPTPKEVEACAAYWLPSELDQVKPEVVFLLGSTASSLISGIDLDACHGIPQQGKLFGWTGWVVPLFHPAAGLHETRMMTPQLSDWEILGPWLGETGECIRGQWQWPVDQHPYKDYVLVDSASGVSAYLVRYAMAENLRVIKDLMCVDTESYSGEHFSTQVSVRPGTAIMVKRSEVPAHGYLLECIHSWGEITFHNAPADLPFVEPVRKYRDSMVESYNLGNLPQGLKALGLRLCGVKMKSYLDVVTGPSRQALLDWMVDALTVEMDAPDTIVQQLKTKTKTIVRPNPVEKTLWRIAKHTMENPEYDPWERLDLIQNAAWPDMPRLGIAHVPEHELVEYGCQDADIGLRVALELEKRRKRQMEEWDVQEEDRDQ